RNVTGVQTCALPISQALRRERGRFDYVRELSALAATGLRRRDLNALCASLAGFNPPLALLAPGGLAAFVIGMAAGWVALTVLAKIGRASCRERGEIG